MFAVKYRNLKKVSIICVVAVFAVAAVFFWNQSQKGIIKIKDPETLRLYVRNEATVNRYLAEHPKGLDRASASCQEITEPELVEFFCDWCEPLPKAQLIKGKFLMLGGWDLELYAITDRSRYTIGINFNESGDEAYTAFVGAADVWKGNVTLTEEQYKTIVAQFSDYDHGEYHLIKDIHD